MTHKKKFILLVLGVLFFGVMAWNLALIETIQLSKELSLKEERLTQLKTAPQKIARIEQELASFKGSTQQYKMSVEQMRRNLLFEVSDLASQYKLKIDDYPSYFETTQNEFTLYTSPIYLSGKYKNMVEFIYALERKQTVGKISSASFIIKETPRTKKRMLKLNLYIQSINS